MFAYNFPSLQYFMTIEWIESRRDHGDVDGASDNDIRHNNRIFTMFPNTKTSRWSCRESGALLAVERVGKVL